MSAEGALRHGIGAGFELIETLGWSPETGFVRLERHIARLAASARELGFSFDEPAIRSALVQSVKTQDAIWLRIRLTLDRDGNVNVAARPFTPLSPDTAWTVRMASARLDSGDALLRHKTSRREVYDTARAEYPASQADEVLLCNEKGEVCEGTITSLFIPRADGVLLSPPLSCGLLAGVLRQELLAEGRAIEAVLKPDDLAERSFFMGNSLRGLIRARIVMA